jgi:hypothetical protein
MSDAERKNHEYASDLKKISNRKLLTIGKARYLAIEY